MAGYNWNRLEKPDMAKYGLKFLEWTKMAK